MYSGISSKRKLCSFSFILAYIQQYITTSFKFVCTHLFLFQRQCLHTFDSCVEILVYSIFILIVLKTLIQKSYFKILKVEVVASLIKGMLCTYSRTFWIEVNKRLIVPYAMDSPLLGMKIMETSHCAVKWGKIFCWKMRQIWWKLPNKSIADTQNEIISIISMPMAK